MEFSWDMWIAPIQSVGSDLIAFAPNLITALLFLLAGLILSWLVQLLALFICKVLRIDNRISHLWLFRLWSKNIRGHKPSRSISKFFYYLVLFIFVLLSVKVLGGDTSEKILGSLLSLVPRVFSFMMILFLGFLMAMFLSVIAQVVLVSSNIKHPNFWGKVIAWGTFGVAIVFSLEQLGIAGRLVTIIILIVLGSLGLSLAIAVGLGCKDLAREFIIELLKKDRND
jgi:hypothetical protein